MTPATASIVAAVAAAADSTSPLHRVRMAAAKAVEVSNGYVGRSATHFPPFGPSAAAALSRIVRKDVIWQAFNGKCSLFQAGF